MNLVCCVITCDLRRQRQLRLQLPCPCPCPCHARARLPVPVPLQLHSACACALPPLHSTDSQHHRLHDHLRNPPVLYHSLLGWWCRVCFHPPCIDPRLPCHNVANLRCIQRWERVSVSNHDPRRRTSAASIPPTSTRMCLHPELALKCLGLLGGQPTGRQGSGP